VRVLSSEGGDYILDTGLVTRYAVLVMNRLLFVLLVSNLRGFIHDLPREESPNSLVSREIAGALPLTLSHKGAS